MSMTKREFLKGGAATAAGVTLAGLIGRGDAEAAAGRKESNSALKSMLRRIRDLKAERAIRFKLASYARALDRLDTELAATLFAPDSYVDYGTNPITGQVIYKGSGAGLMKWLHEVDSSIYNLGGQFQHVACQSFILDEHLHCSRRAGSTAGWTEWVGHGTTPGVHVLERAHSVASEPGRGLYSQT